MWPLAATTSIGVVAGSLAPAEALPILAPDYALHFVAYATVGLAWLLAVVWCPGQIGGPGVRARRVRAATVLGAVIAMGAVLELMQHFVGRTTDIRDLVANIAGAAMGWAVWSRLVRVCDVAEMDHSAIPHSTPPVDKTSAPM